MGCSMGSRSSSEQKLPAMLTNRAGDNKAGRRLTVNGGSAGVGVGVGGEAANFTDAEVQLDGMDVMNLLKSEVKQGVGKCAVFSSMPDPNMKESFKNKLVSRRGSLDGSIGFACKKGLKPKSPNQDSWAILNGGDDFAMYLVCDGHGTDGHKVSDLAINMIPKFILSSPDVKTNLPDVLAKTFPKMHQFILKSAAAQGFDADLSGCTATVVFHDKQAAKLTVAHVGDSGSCIGRRSEGSKILTTKVLVEDHKPEHPEERARIESRGGRVEYDGYANHRVYGGTTDAPGMNMSRALGDDLGHRIAGITCEPTINEYMLDPADRFFCVCSDGVWEFLKADLVASMLESGKNPTDGCEKVAKMSWDCWMKEERGEVVDDITALLVKLAPKKS